MKVKLKEIVSEFIVPQRNKPKQFGGDIPWCRIEDINGKYLNGTKSNKLVTKQTVKEMNLRIIPPNSIVFSCSATIGVVAITTVPLCTNQTFIAMVPSRRIDVDFLYYYLSLCRPKFERLASITTIPYISRTSFEEFVIDLPPLETQKTIAKILSDIDAKIIINEKANLLIEELLKSIFDYWFLELNFPISQSPADVTQKGNLEGKPYKYFGGKVKWNKDLQREIPEGWLVQPIDECCTIVDCLHSRKPDLNFESEDQYLLQLENILDNGLLDLTTKYYVNASDYKEWTSKIEVVSSDIVITNAGRVAATAQIPEGVVAGIGRNITAIRPLEISPIYLYLSFRGPDIQRQIKLNTDSGSFFTSLNVKGIKQLLILRPNKDIENKFEGIVTPFRVQRESNQKENQKLVSLRNWLMPILIGGNVTF